MIRFLDLHRQYEGIRGEMDAAMAAVLGDSAFIGGKYAQEFEQAFAAYQRVPHCVGVANGTDALEIAIEALDLPRGSEIVVPAYTFIATSESVTRTGHRVVFCDCDPRTYTLSVPDLARRVTARTSAVIAVHLYGHPCDMDPVLELASAHELKVIEDCAQAHGAEYKGRRVGGLGDVGTFSFYPGKNLGAYGDAGAIVTRDKALARRCRMMANHGRVEKYDHDFEGRNSRLDGLQAAVLSVKLRHLEAWTERRIQIAGLYQRLLDGAGPVLPLAEPWARHVYHLFVVRSPRRDALQAHLKAAGIETAIHYPSALPMLKAYTSLEQDCSSMFSVAAAGEVLSLPMGEHLADGDVEQIASAIRAFR